MAFGNLLETGQTLEVVGLGAGLAEQELPGLLAVVADLLVVVEIHVHGCIGLLLNRGRVSGLLFLLPAYEGVHFIVILQGQEAGQQRSTSTRVTCHEKPGSLGKGGRWTGRRVA